MEIIQIYEDLYIKGYRTIPEVKQGTKAYMKFYCHERPHQSLEYQTPYAVFTAQKFKAEEGE